jgi:hypothetical protein
MMIPLSIVWILLAATVLALLAWRKMVTREEDDNLHVLDAAAVQKTTAQAAMAQKLELIDKWGKIATIVAVVYGLILAGLYVYQGWIQNSRLGA